jgi:glutaredoxin
MSDHEDKTITLYTLPGCVQCKGAQRRLDKQHVRYEVKDAAAEDNLRHLKEDLGFQQAPVMEDEDGNAVSGFNPEFIDQHARDVDYQAGHSAEQQEFQQALGKLAQGMGPAQVLDEATQQRQEQQEAAQQAAQQAPSRPKVSM